MGMPNRDDIYKAAMGQKGSVVMDDTAEHADGYMGLVVLADAAFDTVVGNCDSLDGVSVSAGVVIYGDFTSVTLTSGTVLGYLKD